MSTLVYKGTDIYRNLSKEEKLYLSNKYIVPWHNEVIELCKNNPNAVIIVWHTYDTYGGGKHNQVTTGSELRPLGEVFSRMDAHGKDLKQYFRDFKKEILEDDQLSKEKAYKIAKIFTQNLSKYSKLGYDKFEVDFPYKTFGEIDAAINHRVNTQLTFELRKDIFDQVSPEIISDIRKSLKEAIAEMKL